MLTALSQFWNQLNRRKLLQDDIMETPLNRCLNTFDLTLLGKFILLLQPVWVSYTLSSGTQALVLAMYDACSALDDTSALFVQSHDDRGVCTLTFL